MEKVNILGVNISNITQDEALNKVQGFLNDWRQHFIVTPNPEIILEATEADEELWYILNHADLALADGVALKLAARFYGKKIKRVTGADMTVEILKLAEKENKHVVIFNWSRGLSSGLEIKQALARKFPKLAVYVQAIERDNVDILADLHLPTGQIKSPLPPLLKGVNDFAPDIIFCALGSPYQEKFIYHNLTKMPSARLGLSVGGSFDFLTGKIKRAPVALRNIGLEWLWRLIKQPKRIKRIYRATVIFSWRFFVFFFILRWFYRPNIAVLLFKRENNDYKILIVERVGDKEHWQLPQGGTDGDDLARAGARELKEETNIESFKSVAVLRNLFKYEFNKRFDENGLPVKYAPIQRGFKGQKQSLFIAEFTGQDSEIKVNDWEHSAWRWVEADKLIESLHPVRREAAKIFLAKFWQAVKIGPL